MCDAAVETQPDADDPAFKNDTAKWHQAQQQWVDSWGGAPFCCPEARRSAWWEQSMTVLGYLVFAAREIVPRTPEEPQLCGTTVTDILLHLRGKAPRWKYESLCSVGTPRVCCVSFGMPGTAIMM